MGFRGFLIFIYKTWECRFQGLGPFFKLGFQASGLSSLQRRSHEPSACNIKAFCQKCYEALLGSLGFRVLGFRVWGSLTKLNISEQRMRFLDAARTRGSQGNYPEGPSGFLQGVLVRFQ